MDEMHVADNILKEVKEGKIADIFAEPDKTKVFLQLKELEMIKVSEEKVEITEEGELALAKGIKSYFAHKRATRPLIPAPEPVVEKNEPLLDIPAASVAVPAAVILFILLMLLVLIDIGNQ